MVTLELIASLDRKNLSKNADLSATRFKEDFSAATSEQKNMIAELSGRKKNTLYKVYTDGVISTRVLVATSFVLNTSPYWYTGEAEDKEEYSDIIMRKFLIKKGYTSVLPEPELATKDKPKRAYTRRGKQAAPPEEIEIPTQMQQEAEAPQEAAAPTEVPQEIEMPTEAPQEPLNDWLTSESVQGITLEVAHKLLEAIYLKAEAQNPNAVANKREIIRILLS